MGDRVKALITVKTYPSPSLSYEEVVCTAGILEDGCFIRLYPIDYRYRPYTDKFSYKFICKDPECRGHKMANIDWEVGQLYRSMMSKHGDETLTCDEVKEKFFGEICGSDKDTHFFVGTILE